MKGCRIGTDNPGHRRNLGSRKSAYSALSAVKTFRVNRCPHWLCSCRLSGDMWRRYLFVLTFAWWMGGLTFYALVVIPTAEHVLGNHREVGFITQQVTMWLTMSGFVPLLVLLGNMVGDWGFAR